MRVPLPFLTLAVLMLTPRTSAGQPAVIKVHEIPEKGLTFKGKLNEKSPPLAALKGAPHTSYRVKLQKRQSYVIDLVSKDFDSFLILAEAAGKIVAYDNDGGKGQHSQLVIFASSGGIHRLLAASLNKQLGTFQLSVRAAMLSDKQLAAAAEKLNVDGVRLYQQGIAPAAVGKLRTAYQICRKLYPAKKYPTGHPDLATSLHNLAAVLHALKQLPQARSYYERAVSMRRKIYSESKYPQGHPELATSLNNLGSVLQAMGRFRDAVPFYQQCLAMLRRLYTTTKYPAGHPNLAQSLDNVGLVLQPVGRWQEALTYHRQSLAMRRRLYPGSKYPNGHPGIAGNLNNIGFVMWSLGHAEGVP